MALKLGLLLPRSDMYPKLALDFINGFKFSFEKEGAVLKDADLIIESTGTASDENLIKAAEKLVLQENVDAVISFCGMTLLNQFIKLFDSYEKPLIHIDLGSSYLKVENKSPYVLHVTLGVCQASYLAGVYAAKNYGKKAYAAASMYDGGYQLTESFVRGFASEGGYVEKFYVSPMDYKSETFDALVEDIEAIKPDVVFAVFSYKEGEKVFNVMANSKAVTGVPILALPLMTDVGIFKKNTHIKDVMSMASWSFDSETAPMKLFLQSFKNQFGTNPNIITLLGLETALTIASCISSEGKLEKNLEEAIKNTALDSPRGAVTFNNLNESQTEFFMLRKFEFTTDGYKNITVESFDTKFTEDLYKEFESLPYTGWQNPYICT